MRKRVTCTHTDMRTHALLTRHGGDSILDAGAVPSKRCSPLPSTLAPPLLEVGRIREATSGWGLGQSAWWRGFDLVWVTHLPSLHPPICKVGGAELVS